MKSTAWSRQLFSLPLHGIQYSGTQRPGGFADKRRYCFGMDISILSVAETTGTLAMLLLAASQAEDVGKV